MGPRVLTRPSRQVSSMQNGHQRERTVAGRLRAERWWCWGPQCRPSQSNMGTLSNQRWGAWQGEVTKVYLSAVG